MKENEAMIPLSRDMKIRLLQAIKRGAIELRTICELDPQTPMDWGAMTDEDLNAWYAIYQRNKKPQD